MNTIRSMLLFTNDGMYFQLPVHEIPDTRWKDIGSALVNVVSLAKDQKIIGMFPIEEYSPDTYVHFVTSSGMVKKTSLAEYNTSQRKRAIHAVKIKPDDTLIGVMLGQEQDQLLLVTEDAMAIHLALKEITPMGRNTAGVKAIKLGENDKLVAAYVTKHKDERSLDMITVDGIGKRISVSNLDVQARGTKGLVAIKRRKTNPHRVIFARVEDESAHSYNYETNQGKMGTLKFDTLEVSDQGGVGKALVPLEKGEQITGVHVIPLIDVRQEEEETP